MDHELYHTISSACGCEICVLHLEESIEFLAAFGFGVQDRVQDGVQDA